MALSSEITLRVGYSIRMSNSKPISVIQFESENLPEVSLQQGLFVGDESGKQIVITSFCKNSISFHFLISFDEN